MSDVTKLPLHFCKFHRELTVSSVSAMTLRYDVPNDKTKRMFSNGHDKKRRMFGIFMFVKLWEMSDLQKFLPDKRLFAC